MEPTPPIPPVTPNPSPVPTAEKVHWGWYVAGGFAVGLLFAHLKLKMKCSTDAQKIKNETAKEVDEMFRKAMKEAEEKGETLSNFRKMWETA